MKTKNKIYLGFFLILAFGLVMGVTGIAATQKMADLADEQYGFHAQAAQVAEILGSHYAWRQELCVSMIEERHFEGSVDPEGCALGKWLSGDEAKNVTDSRLLALMEKIVKPHNAMHEMAKTIQGMTDAGDMATAEDLLVREVLPLANETIDIINEMQVRLIEEIEEKGGESLNVGMSTRNLLVFIVVFSLVASIILALVVSGSIMRPIHMITRALGQVSMGALDVDVDYRVDDEIGKLVKLFGLQVQNTKEQLRVTEMLAEGDLTARMEVRSDKDTMGFAMQKMVAKLGQMFGEIDGATAQVSVGAQEIAEASQSLAQGSSEQAAAVEELSSSIGEINVKTMKNAEQAAAAAGLAVKIKEDAEQGSRQMEQMMRAVREIGQASQSISKVIKAIDDIAFQTNILSLNAAVEAARAGQHGKGFAVVAEEVRNLASKSAEAARDTGSLIANSMEKAELGARIAGETAASLGNIVSGIKESTLLVGEIASSSEEQREAIRQINRGIEQVAMVVQQNNATAEQAAASAAQMSEQSGGLREMMSRFTLKKEEKAEVKAKALPSVKKAASAKRIQMGEDMGKY